MANPRLKKLVPYLVVPLLLFALALSFKSLKVVNDRVTEHIASEEISTSLSKPLRVGFISKTDASASFPSSVSFSYVYPENSVLVNPDLCYGFSHSTFKAFDIWKIVPLKRSSLDHVEYFDTYEGLFPSNPRDLQFSSILCSPKDVGTLTMEFKTHESLDAFVTKMNDVDTWLDIENYLLDLDLVDRK